MSGGIPDVSRLIMSLPQMPMHELWRLSDAASKELVHRPRPEGRPTLYDLLYGAQSAEAQQRDDEMVRILDGIDGTRQQKWKDMGARLRRTSRPHLRLVK